MLIPSPPVTSSHMFTYLLPGDRFYQKQAMRILSSFPIVSLLSLALFISPSESHSWITRPLTYNRRFLGTCDGYQCSLACPNKLESGNNNSVSDPEAIYSRGETVAIKWLKNNHRGGFIRLALVPVNSMFSHAAHDKLAFFYTYWDSWIVDCGGGFENCGSDEDNEAFETTVQIPTCLRDGNYVMGYVWYGGLHYSRETGSFADYFHCAHVRVEGGPLSDVCTANYRNGQTGDSVRGTECQTAVDMPRMCPRDGDCLNQKSFFGIPKPFQNGGAPSFSVMDVDIFSGGNTPVSSMPTVTPAPLTNPPPATDNDNNGVDDDDDNDDDDKDTDLRYNIFRDGFP